ncbi:dTDP-4-dehydrorhamnose reductase [Denitratisoma sp. agr-D3]
MTAAPTLLILGSQGQVGWELQRALAPLGKVVAWGRHEADLSQPTSLARQIDTLAPALIVNAAAYTAVDKAESEAALARRINAEAPGVIAQAATRCGARLIQYSTDYVFAGDLERPYREDDATAPRSVYGGSKQAGEAAVLAASANHLVLRTAWVYGRHGNNFAKTILRLAREKDHLQVVNDQFGAPTPASLVADVTAHVVARLLRSAPPVPGGLYHLTASGHTSWHGFAQAIVSQAQALGAELKLRAEAIEAIPTSDYPLPAPRPANSRLDCGKLANVFGLHLPAWQTLLPHILADILTP